MITDLNIDCNNMNSGKNLEKKLNIWTLLNCLYKYSIFRAQILCAVTHIKEYSSTWGNIHNDKSRLYGNEPHLISILLKEKKAKLKIWIELLLVMLFQ